MLHSKLSQSSKPTGKYIFIIMKMHTAISYLHQHNPDNTTNIKSNIWRCVTLRVLIHWAWRGSHPTVSPWPHAHSFHLSIARVIRHSLLMHGVHGLFKVMESSLIQRCFFFTEAYLLFANYLCFTLCIWCMLSWGYPEGPCGGWGCPDPGGPGLGPIMLWAEPGEGPGLGPIMPPGDGPGPGEGPGRGVPPIGGSGVDISQEKRWACSSNKIP